MVYKWPWTYGLLVDDVTARTKTIDNIAQNIDTTYTTPNVIDNNVDVLNDKFRRFFKDNLSSIM